MKASEGISGGAHQRVTVDCTRTKNGAALRNPARCFEDALTNADYGLASTASELDADTINAKATAWSGRTFDAVFDKQTDGWDALGRVLQMAHAAPVASGGLISIAEDEQVFTTNFSFTEDNINDLRVSFVQPASTDYDGVEGEYKNPDDNAPEYAIYPANSVNPEKVTLFGCKDSSAAQAFVERAWLQSTYRRTLYVFAAELDGHVLQVGTPASIFHQLLGDEAVTVVVSSVRPTSETETEIEAYQYQPEVFA
jgi:hypothetical protein